MERFFELEFIGRGGQGVKTAAELVGKVALDKGKYIQSFPDYGPERKGAPVRAFTRISDIPIRGCSSEASPNVIVIIDQTLAALQGTFFTVNDDTIVIVNTTHTIAEIKSTTHMKGVIHTVDATTIALETIKVNFTNSAMLGALAKITGLFTLEEIKEAFRMEFARKLDENALNNNDAAIERAFNEVK
ncbi:MAG: 2-oxoacid:acceptor oxidoreductase family protein [Candidatus Woesearchaeota archaeon]